MKDKSVKVSFKLLQSEFNNIKKTAKKMGMTTTDFLKLTGTVIWTIMVIGNSLPQ